MCAILGPCTWLLKQNILVLKQFIFLPELSNFRPNAPLRASQRADLTTQLLFNLPACLQVSL